MQDKMYITEPGIMGNPAVMEKIENMREFMIDKKIT